jgi:MOSC domain-containing protein YiiM
MWKGSVVSIHIARGAADPTQSVSEARVVMGKGLDGDRYYHGCGTWSSHPGTGRHITLIESETLEALERESGIILAPGASRRNVLTRGVPLNHLVDRNFHVGQAVLRGMRLCEPCKHIEDLTQPGVIAALLHRGGLRAEVFQEGIIRVGDTVEEA